MNEKHEKFLPLGSVVLLEGATKRLMITGFCTMDNEDRTTLYDYSGCLYPEGVISSDETALFNHDQIEKVFSLGYSDEEDVEFKKKLQELLKANNMVKDEAPAAVLEQTPPVAPAAAPVVEAAPAVSHERLATEEPVLKPIIEPIFAEKAETPVMEATPAPEAIPAVGPGLPGYVAPATPAQEATPVPEAIPAVGPGLPGYVAPPAAE